MTELLYYADAYRRQFDAQVLEVEDEGERLRLLLDRTAFYPGGGGQPHGATDEIRLKRTAGIYSDDEKSVQRCSHHNPMITKIYEDFLGEPLSHKAHELLHTDYKERLVYKK